MQTATFLATIAGVLILTGLAVWRFVQWIERTFAERIGED